MFIVSVFQLHWGGKVYNNVSHSWSNALQNSGVAAPSNTSMRSKKRTVGALSQPTQNLPHQPQHCFEGESLVQFLKSIHREIETARSLESTLPLKFWIKQQFAVGVNEVTRALDRMPPKNRDDDEAPYVYLQAILLASGCSPRSLTKHLPSLAASRNVTVISVKDRKEGSLRLGQLLRLKTTIAIGIKAKGNAINKLIKEVVNDNKIDSTEA